MATSPLARELAITVAGGREIRIHRTADLLAGRDSPRQIARGGGTAVRKVSFVRQDSRLGLLLTPADAESGELVLDLEAGRHSAQRAGWQDAAATPGAWKTALESEDSQRRIAVIQPDGARRQIPLDASRTVTAHALCPPGEHLSITLLAIAFDDRGQQGIDLYDAESGMRLRRLSAHSERIGDLAFSQDGCLLASCSDDRTVNLWWMADLDTTVLRRHGWLHGLEVRLNPLLDAPSLITSDYLADFLGLTHGAHLLFLDVGQPAAGAQIGPPTAGEAGMLGMLRSWWPATLAVPPDRTLPVALHQVQQSKPDAIQLRDISEGLAEVYQDPERGFAPQAQFQAEAVIQANSTPGDFEIRLPPGTHRLSIQGAFESQARSGDLNILANYPQTAVSIVGAGAEPTTIDASGLGDRIFQVWAGATLHVEGVTLTGGWAPVLDPGGGILNLGTLTIRDSVIAGNRAYERGGGIGIHSLDGARPATLSVINSTISDNSAAYGGGISSIDGAVTLSNTTVSGNAAQFGGGIFTASWGRGTPALTVRDSILSDNQAGDGGGLFHMHGSAILENTTISGNSAGIGGGIENRAALTLGDSTLTGNSAQSLGGAINNRGLLTLTDSTLGGNSAVTTGGSVSNWGTLTVINSILRDSQADSGGGLANVTGTLTITQGSLLSGNTAQITGGGIWNQDTLILSSSTLSGNSAELAGGGIQNSAESMLTLIGSSVLDNFASLGGGIENSLGATANLRNSTVSGNAAEGRGGGVYNSWQSSTLTLVESRVADNSGDPDFDPHAFTPARIHDQRGAGFDRLRGGRIDIGAFESYFNPWHNGANPFDVVAAGFKTALEAQSPWPTARSRITPRASPGACTTASGAL